MGSSLNLFGSESSNETTNTNISNSYNTSTTLEQAVDRSGNVIIGGSDEQSNSLFQGKADNIAKYLAIAGVVIAGVYILTSKKL